MPRGIEHNHAFSDEHTLCFLTPSSSVFAVTCRIICCIPTSRRQVLKLRYTMCIKLTLHCTCIAKGIVIPLCFGSQVLCLHGPELLKTGSALWECFLSSVMLFQNVLGCQLVISLLQMAHLLCATCSHTNTQIHTLTVCSCGTSERPVNHEDVTGCS